MADRKDKKEQSGGPGEAGAAPESPFVPMFRNFRADLDEHTDRRERIVKASRDVTAASKKIIFTLQRCKNIGGPLPPFATKTNEQYWTIISTQFRAIAADVQDLNEYRYPQLTWGNQEFMEALSFQYYLENQKLISYEQSKVKVAELCRGDEKEAKVVPLTVEDYVLGIFDMIGELMRFSITSMATNGKLPAGRLKKKAAKSTTISQTETHEGDKMDVDEPANTEEEQPPRTVLDDLREIRLVLEMFEPAAGSKFYDECEKKARVMRECVDKVEKALYSMTVRGSERPKGWRPEMEERRPEVESY